MVCLGVDFFVFIMFDILSACWQFSAIFFFRYFSTTHSFFSVLDSSYTNVRSFIAILQVSDTLIPGPPPSLFSLLFKLTG